jgi:hypothetical protein
MPTYEVRKAGTIKYGWKHRLMSALPFAAILFALRFGWNVLAPSGHGRHWSVVEIVTWSAAVAILSALIPMANRVPGYTLLVDDDSVTGVSQYGGLMKWFVSRRTIRPGRVRTIFAVRTTPHHSGGIGVSERSRLGARMWGFVYIPKTLPEFDRLKALVESWRSIE